MSSKADPTKASNCEWYTPAKYIALVREVLTTIDLDPCSCAEANKTVKAKRYYTKEDNGLLKHWIDYASWPASSAKVFVNPPYSEAKTWIAKLFAEYESGNVSSAILLTNSTTDGQWFADLKKYRNNFLCCFVTGRIKFISPNNQAMQPRYPSVFTYLGDSRNMPQEFIRFQEVFSKIGIILK